MFTIEEINHAVEMTVKEAGEDFVYASKRPPTAALACHYRWTHGDVELGLVTKDKVGQAACFVGQVLDRLIMPDGVTTALDVTVPYPNRLISTIQNNTKAASALVAGGLFPEGVGYAFDRAQGCNDAGQRWGYVGEQYHEGLADWEAGLE